METDHYPNEGTDTQKLAWHERQHESAHVALDNAKACGSMRLFLFARIYDLANQRDNALSLNNESKTELNYALSELHKLRDAATCKQALQVRPEPSRLEIAAMLVAGRLSSTVYVTEVKGTWIKYALDGADALIAAAKEVAK